MPIPNFPGKHELTALFQPRDYLGHVWKGATPGGRPIPEGAVFVYSPRLLRQVVDRHEVRERRVSRRSIKVHEVQVPGGAVAVVGGFGIGGPAAATTMEELIGAGVRRAVSIGGAGGLHPAQGIGDLVVCNGAVRDEGVSYHYLPPGERYVYPNEELTARLLEAVEERAEHVVVGRTWTTDAPYRETREEVLHYRAEGVLTVEMEAASLAAVALHRGVAFATAFAVMDSLAGETWRPEGLGHQDALTALNILFDAAATILV
ncbi:nucleoside phosphorylase [Amycolatopsis nigrescens]|uniref:nucleoside phosphorylase n=1 Tax=Amycolatopsis nigrescens TaxID=381445 RepID=UPI0003A6C8D4|nr:nucleoside phosphorylase [Amycolatopsis nigrescens]